MRNQAGRKITRAFTGEVIESEIMDRIREDEQLKEKLISAMMQACQGEGCTELYGYLLEQYIDEVVDNITDILYEIDGEWFYDAYAHGCQMLGIKVEYCEKEIEDSDVNPYNKEKIKEVYSSIFAGRHERDTKKDAEKVKKEINGLLSEKVYNNRKG